MLEQQIFNYFLWLKDRGQGYLVPSTSSLPPEMASPQNVSPSVASPPLKAKIETKPLLESPLRVEQPVYPKYKLLFLSETQLQPAEQDMVSRIATALKIAAEDFAIAAGPEGGELAAAQDNCAMVFMGEEARNLVNVKAGLLSLHIPHPRAMLSEPQLKVAAWESLQKLKAAL